MKKRSTNVLELIHRKVDFYKIYIFFVHINLFSYFVLKIKTNTNDSLKQRVLSSLVLQLMERYFQNKFDTTGFLINLSPQLLSRLNQWFHSQFRVPHPSPRIHSPANSTYFQPLKVWTTFYWKPCTTGLSIGEKVKNYWKINNKKKTTKWVG